MSEKIIWLIPTSSVLRSLSLSVYVGEATMVKCFLLSLGANWQLSLLSHRSISLLSYGHLHAIITVAYGTSLLQNRGAFLLPLLLFWNRGVRREQQRSIMAQSDQKSQAKEMTRRGPRTAEHAH